MVHTDNPRPSDFAFAHMAVQTDSVEDEDPLAVPEELKQSIRCHLWLVNLEVCAGTPPSMLRQPVIPRYPHPDRPTPLTMSQLLDSSTQLEAAYRDRDLSCKALSGRYRKLTLAREVFRTRQTMTSMCVILLDLLVDYRSLFPRVLGSCKSKVALEASCLSISRRSARRRCAGGRDSIPGTERPISKQVFKII